MSWLRVEGRMPNHRKVARLSDAAFRLHISAKCWCVEERTDGHVPAGIPETLPRAPQGKALRRIVDELVGGGLWDPVDDGHQVHDFLDYNPSAAALEAKAEAGRRGGQRSGDSRRSRSEAPASARAAPSAQPSAQAKPKQTLKQNRSNGEAPAQALSDPDPLSDPRSKEAAVDPKNLSGFPRSGTHAKAEAAAAAPADSVGENLDEEPAPRSLKAALLVPICARAAYVVGNPDMAQWLEPEQWPEVRAIAATLARATEQPVHERIGTYDRDAGVKAIVELFAAGYFQRDLERIVRALVLEPWWTADGKSRSLASLTPEVVRKTAATLPSELEPSSPYVAAVKARIAKEKAANGSS